MAGRLPDVEELRSRYTYNPETGELVYNTDLKGKAQIGGVAGTVNSEGYVLVSFNGVYYGAHRVIYYMQTGKVPVMVDHINGNRADNRWTNLRSCTPRQNLYNTAKYSTNTTGHKGVTLNGSRYRVRIYVDGKPRNFGQFATLEEAVSVANKARNKYHGEFANNG